MIFYQFNNNLIRFCSDYTHSLEAAEEIVSDVFVSCWLNRKSLTDIQNPKNYLYVAVKNRSLNYLKKYSHIQIVPLEDSEEVIFIDATDPNRELERKEFFYKMDRIVATLPKQSLQVFRLVKEDGLKCKEVAALLKISPRTVHTHLYRAIKKLNDALREHLGKESSILANKIYLLLITSQLFLFSL